jgi:hypothetical protein
VSRDGVLFEDESEWKWDDDECEEFEYVDECENEQYFENWHDNNEFCCGDGLDCPEVGAVWWDGVYWLDGLCGGIYMRLFECLVLAMSIKLAPCKLP